MKGSNQIESEDTITEMIYLKNNSIVLSLGSNIKFLKRMKNKNYEVYKSIETQSIFLLSIENLLYSFDDSSIYLINIDNYSLISTAKLNKTKGESFSEKMKPIKQ